MNVATTREQAERQELEMHQARKEYLRDLEAILDTPHGIRFFRALFSQGYMEHTIMGDTKGDTFFNLGQRSVALAYWNDIKNEFPDKFIEILNGGKTHAG